MRAHWEALHESLARSVRTLEAEQQFNEIKRRRSVLGRFDDPVSLLVYLNGTSGDLDEKDAIYAAFVETVQARGEDAKLAMALLWLGLWPGLDAIYGRRVRLFVEAPEELVSEISDRFTRLAHVADLGRVHRVAATLTRSTERDVVDNRRRYWRDASRRDDNELSKFLGGLRTTSQRDPSELGVPAGVSEEEEVEAIRKWLAEVVGADADLVIGAAIYGESQRELADRLGLTHEAARKRFQRAMDRVRERLGAKR